MEAILEWLQDNIGTVLVVTGVSVVSFMAFKNIFSRNEVPMDVRRNFPKNKVILVQLPRGPRVPCISPFALKLETYLRMANIPYETVHGFYFSRKGKLPYIFYNGEEVPDVEFIIDFLNKEKGVDLNKHLTTEQKAIARAFLKMVEENTYWTGVAERYINAPDAAAFNRIFGPGIFNRFTVWGFKRRWRNYMWGHGIGRHSLKEIRSIMEKDIRALSVYLGDKMFFFGDQPSEIDSTLFGFMAQVRWQDTEIPYAKFMNGEFQNLARYCERMRERFWLDWDDCITHDFTRRATK